MRPTENILSVNQLDAIHSRERWKNVRGSGFRWRVEVSPSGGFDAVVIGPRGGELFRKNFPGSARAETAAIGWANLLLDDYLRG